MHLHISKGDLSDWLAGYDPGGPTMAVLTQKGQDTGRVHKAGCHSSPSLEGPCRVAGLQSTLES